MSSLVTEVRVPIQIVRSILLITYFAFDLDLCVCQPSSHFFHKCQVKQMIFKPTEQSKTTKLNCLPTRWSLGCIYSYYRSQGLQQERFIYLGKKICSLRADVYFFHSRGKGNSRRFLGWRRVTESIVVLNPFTDKTTLVLVLRGE